MEQWHAIANPHLGVGSRRIRNSGLSLATERVQIQSGMHEFFPQTKPNRVSEGRTHQAVGAVQEAHWQRRMSMPSSQGSVLTQWTDN